MSHSYYDVLDLTPDATDSEVKTAYLRMKNAYSKDSVATYSLFDKVESTKQLDEIEEAYLVLSNPEKRSHYDRRNGFKRPNDQISQDLKKSIRVGNSLPPRGASNKNRGALNSGMAELPGYNESESIFTTHSSVPSAAPTHSSDEGPISFAVSSVPESEDLSLSKHQVLGGYEKNEALEREILETSEFSGPFIKKVREYKKLSIEDLSRMTKIRKSYLDAIESEDPKSLPAPVYVRGFVYQVAKTLRLDAEKVANTYSQRFKKIKEGESTL